MRLEAIDSQLFLNGEPVGVGLDAPPMQIAEWVAKAVHEACQAALAKEVARAEDWLKFMIQAPPEDKDQRRAAVDALERALRIIKKL